MEKNNIIQIEKIEDYLRIHYEFKFNVVLNKIEYKRRSGTDYILMTDYYENSILRELLKNDIKCSQHALRNILYSDFSRKYDPFMEYFSSLDPWDETTDYINELAQTVNTTDNELWQRVFCKWIVAVVASLLDNDVVNHTVLIFSGPQGIGKTSWMLNLIPKALGDYIYSGMINPNNKDTLIQLSECMLINMDELENMNRTEIGSFKEYITKKVIRFRRPYGYNSENFTRRASFMGSLNSSQFLNDLTGSRRFLCFLVKEVNYKHEINMDNVYAQALHLYNRGFHYYFNENEIEEMTKNNEEYQIRTAEEELLLTWFEQVPVEQATNFYTATDIMTKLAENSKMSVNNGSLMSMGKALRKHNFIRTKRNDRYVYAVRAKNYGEVEKETRQKRKVV